MIILLKIIGKVISRDIKPLFLENTPMLFVELIMLSVYRFSIVFFIAILSANVKAPKDSNTSNTHLHESALKIIAQITSEIIGDNIAVD